MINNNQFGSKAPDLEATEAALVREIAIMLGDWEASGELASEFAIRLLAFFRKCQDQILQFGPEEKRPPT